MEVSASSVYRGETFGDIGNIGESGETFGSVGDIRELTLGGHGLHRRGRVGNEVDSDRSGMRWIDLAGVGISESGLEWFGS